MTKSIKSTKSTKTHHKLLTTLADFMKARNLSAIEWQEGDVRARLEAHTSAPGPQAHPQPSPQQSAQPTAQASSQASAQPAENIVPSPMVGTAYLSPSPEAEPFVKVGDTVQKGQRVMIVEAMKVMNFIEAPRSGIIKAILVQNGEVVEFGTPLMEFTN